MTAKDFIYNKLTTSFSKGVFNAKQLSELLEEYANQREEESCRKCASFVRKDDLKKRDELIKAQDNMIQALKDELFDHVIRVWDEDWYIDYDTKIEQLKKEIQWMTQEN